MAGARSCKILYAKAYTTRQFLSVLERYTIPHVFRPQSSFAELVAGREGMVAQHNEGLLLQDLGLDKMVA